MALSNALAAYEDCLVYFARAETADRGIRVLCPDKTQAQMLRLRMNKARVLLREENCRVYPPDDPRYGKSEYDGLRVTIRDTAEDDNKAWVYVDKWAQTVETVEEIEDEI